MWAKWIIAGAAISANAAIASEQIVRVRGPAPDVEYETSEAFSGRLANALYSVDASIAPDCGEQRVFEIVRIQRVEFNDPLFLALANGKRVDRLILSGTGCGTARTHNVYLFKRDGEPVRIEVFMPGETKAGLLLQLDTIKLLVPYFNGIRTLNGAPCAEKPKPVDTRLLSEPDGKSPWQELWTVRGCGTITSLIVSFVPDGVGTHIEIKVPKNEGGAK